MGCVRVRADLGAISSSLDDAPLTRLHLLAALTVGIGELWNVVDINVSSVLAAAFSGDASVISTRALSWLVASAYLGAFLGAPIFGWAADR